MMVSDCEISKERVCKMPKQEPYFQEGYVSRMRRIYSVDDNRVTIHIQ